MRLIKQKIIVDTVSLSGQSFSLDNVVSFTINNIGDADAYVRYKGESTLMKIDKGTGREFSGLSGFVYDGEMQIDFIGSNSGLVEVVKSITSTNEI